MALIYFYDATELDREQITPALSSTDHHWEFIEEKVSPTSLNPETEVLSVFVTSTVTRKIIEALPKLRVIACRSTGYNNVDLQAAKERDIAVLNVPTYGEATVAAYAFTLLLALTRKLPESLNTSNEHIESRTLLGEDIAGKTIGIIGTGHIGQQAMKIANGFGMHVLAYDPYPKNELQDKYDFQYVSFEAILAQSDYISIHAPYTSSSHHLFNKKQFSKMKKGAILINTARGEIVDTAALLDAVLSGQLGGAGLDVIEGEALLDHHEEIALLRKKQVSSALLKHSVELHILKKLPNVIITPHNAYNTVEAVRRINSTTAKNIIDYWYGVTPNRVHVSGTTMGRLFIARHTESEWNATGQWTGITDVHLSEQGFRQSGQMGLALKEFDIALDIAYCSEQIRTRETLEGMLDASQQFSVDIIRDASINERDYGDFTGKNKWEMRDILGQEAFDALHRGWDVPVPNGETLKTVYDRVIPFYKNIVLPRLRLGQNILIVAHGNSLRALMKYIESIPVTDIDRLNMLFGEIVCYELNPAGHSVHKQTAKINMVPPPA